MRLRPETTPDLFPNQTEAAVLTNGFRGMVAGKITKSTLALAEMVPRFRRLLIGQDQSARAHGIMLPAGGTAAMSGFQLMVAPG